MAYPQKTLLVLLLMLLPVCAFSGQSLVLIPRRTTTSLNDPNLPSTQSWRIEFQIHNWTYPSDYASRLFELDGVGVIVRLYPAQVEIETTRDSFASAAPCFISPPSGSTNVLVRLQKNVTGASAFGNNQFVCEIWNYDGTGYSNSVQNISSTRSSSASGGLIGGMVSGSADLGFLRVFTTLIPLGSKPPTTADGGNWTELKFDGNLTDSSGRGHSGSMPGASFVATPNQVTVAIPKTMGAPVWNNWTSLRAGFRSQLDGSASYSLADGSSTVNYFWQQLSGPTILRWSSRTTSNPTVTGLIFGTYTFSLRATDAAGSASTVSLEVGSVATDDNGVVVPSDPRVTQIFGPMIAFGKNPWGYMDERALTAVKLQNASYLAQGLANPIWETDGQGTVSYPFAGIGPAPGTPGTSLMSAIAATDTTISIADASKLPSLAALPTWILIGNTTGSQEMVRIGATTATTGPATLTVAYDGRGLLVAPAGFLYNNGVVAAQAWPSGTLVGEMRISGTGTLFASDPNRPLCPAGVPGPMGPVVYSAGTVTLTGGQSTVTGNGTSWTDSHGSTNTNVVFLTDSSGNTSSTYSIRVAATHGGGIPFVWWALVTSVQGPTHITTSRSVPGDVDPGPFPSTITGLQYLALEFAPPTSGTELALQNGVGCESETAAFSVPAHDIPTFDNTTQSGVHYSIKLSLGAQSAFGSNFYGSGLAERAFYLRSGWNFANTTANLMDDQWVRDPEICAGWCGGIPLLLGGGVYGAFANVILNPAAKIGWPDLRAFTSSASGLGSLGCNASDTRDSSYLGVWLTFGANYDPDATLRAGWKTALASAYTRDFNCKGPDNSWANGFVFNTAGPALTMTKGSPVVSGASLPSSMCFGVASGMVQVRKGSAQFTGAGLVNGNEIVIDGFRDGQPYTGFFQFSQNGGASGMLAALWPGDNGTFSYVIAKNDYLTAIGIGNDDPQLRENWACTWNNPSQITLDRAWDGPSESNAHLYSYVLAGYGQQPFMLGIKTTSMELASQNDDPTISANYAALVPLAAAWIHDVGYDPVTQGMHYGRIFQTCEPDTIPPPNSAFVARTPGCNNGLDPASIRAARVLTAEDSQGLRIYYESNPSPGRRQWGDVAYGSIWGYAPYTTENVFTDANYVRDENSNASLAAYKWPGFFFGMGMAHQWPAVRVGGLQPARNRTVQIALNLGAAVSAQIVLTAPSGASTTYPCGATSPCAVTVDDRQGSHWYVIQYLSAANQILSQTDPDLLVAVP